MARRLLGAGFPVAVYNRDRTKAAALKTAGAVVADSPREAAAGAAIMISMVADDAASRAIWLGEQGGLAGAARGAVLVECSTLTVSWVNELARAAAARGLELIDAPVAGSKPSAASGELKFLVGGGAAALEKVRPALNAMGQSITHFGPTGSGARVKLINNFMAGVHVVAWAEALTWIEQSGLDRGKTVDFLLAGATGSPIAKTIAPRMIADDYAPNFFLKLMAKDLGYAISEAAAQGGKLTTAAAALERFKQALAAGHGEKDMAAVVLPLRGKS